MGFGKALALTVLGGAAYSVIANLLKDDEEKNSKRHVYLVTSDIVYSGINFTQEARSLVNKLAEEELISNEKFAHWSIQVGDGDDAWFFEIMSENIRKRQDLIEKRWSAGEKDRITEKVQIGLTSHSNRKIAEICNEVIKDKPKYHLIKNNCQHFVVSALKEICNVEETISEADEEAFATIVATFLLLPVVGPAALVPLILE